MYSEETYTIKQLRIDATQWIDSLCNSYDLPDVGSVDYYTRETITPDNYRDIVGDQLWYAADNAKQYADFCNGLAYDINARAKDSDHAWAVFDDIVERGIARYIRKHCKDLPSWQWRGRVPGMVYSIQLRANSEASARAELRYYLKLDRLPVGSEVWSDFS